MLDEAGLERVDALKIDIEGAEDTVLAAFFASAPRSRWPRLVLMEMSGDRWKTDCVALCQGHGYRVARRTRMNVVLELGPEAAPAPTPAPGPALSLSAPA